jgi:hypothetical protein
VEGRVEEDVVDDEDEEEEEVEEEDNEESGVKETNGATDSTQRRINTWKAPSCPNKQTKKETEGMSEQEGEEKIGRERNESLHSGGRPS